MFLCPTRVTGYAHKPYAPHFRHKEPFPEFPTTKIAHKSLECSSQVDFISHFGISFVSLWSIMGRILAIDYGLKRTGIAVSDPMRIIAGGLETVPTAQLEQWLGQYMAANDVDIIVVGKPTQMNGAPSQSWAAIEPFVKRLEARYPDCRVVLHDERFTSVIAHRAMIDGGMKKMARRDKAVVDKISATIILQSYMDSLAYKQLTTQR